MTLCVDKDEAMSGAESSEPLHSETTPESTPPLEEEEDDPLNELRDIYINTMARKTTLRIDSKSALLDRLLSQEINKVNTQGMIFS